MNASTTVFRFSTRAYKPTDIMTPGTFVGGKQESAHGWIEEAMEDGRPERAPARDGVVYVAQSADQARTFGEAEYKCEGFVYEVKAEPIWWAVMCLPEALKTRGNDSTRGASIVGEYWQQEHEWHFLEGPCAEAEVLSLVERPEPMDWTIRRGAVLYSYGRDHDQVAKLWP